MIMPELQSEVRMATESLLIKKTTSRHSNTRTIIATTKNKILVRHFKKNMKRHLNLSLIHLRAIFSHFSLEL